jgi:large subunit ribosomal protein L1
MDIKKALEELKKQKRNFTQSIDVVINLKNFEPKKQGIDLFVELPNGKGKDNKIAIILEKEDKDIEKFCDVLVWKDIEKLSLKEFKKIKKQYDYFICLAKLMPLLAKNFGKVLQKKMPNPQLGCVLVDVDKNKVKALVEKLKNTLRIRNDGNSIKFVIGREDMEEGKILENFNYVYKKIVDALPNKEANVKEILIKLTMSKPIKIK